MIEEVKNVETEVTSTVDPIPESGTESVEIAFNKLFSKTFTTLPMIIRVKYLVDTLDKIPEDEISFSRVNAILHGNICEGDFNILPDEIKTKNDIIELYHRISNAAAGLSVWCKRVCKDCGKEFYLYLSEVDFYRGKNLVFPKRCKNCISASKASKGQE